MTTTISLSCLHHGVQIRCTENPDTIARYTEILKESGWTFPPLTVVQVDGVYRVADGHHRLEAAKNTGLQEIPCKVIEGTEETLFKLAFEGNSMHGLAMSRADWKHAVELTINRFPDKSNRDLAEFCRCSHTTIKRIKDELEASGKYRKPETVTGRDGVTQKVSHAKNSGGTNVPPTETPPPAALADYVTCAQCGTNAHKGMTEQPDTTWRQRGFDENNKYLWLCSDECESEWNKAREAELEKELQEEPEEFTFDEVNTDALPVCTEEQVESTSCGLDCHFFIDVEGTTNPQEALEMVKAQFPQTISNLTMKFCGLYNININSNNININPESFTEFYICCKGKKGPTKFYISKTKYDEWRKVFKPPFDIDQTLTECCRYYNELTGSEMLTPGVVYSKVYAWVLKNWKQEQKPSRPKQNAYKDAGLVFDPNDY